MVMILRIFVILLITSLVIWVLGVTKVFSIKDDITDFSLDNSESKTIHDSNPHMNLSLIHI